MKRERPETQLHVAHDDETEKLREWWKRNGTGIVAGVVIGIGGVGGIQDGGCTKTVRPAKPQSYQEMLGAAAAERSAAASAAAEALVSKYSGSGYADLAQLMLARLALEEEMPRMPRLR